MSTPSIGGKVLDASAVAAVVEGRLTALAWLDAALDLGLVLYLPLLAVVEVRALRPGAGAELLDLIGRTQVVFSDFDAASGAAVEALFHRLGKFDALAGHVVHVARQRGWPALTADPGRLHRLDPTLDADVL